MAITDNPFAAAQDDLAARRANLQAQVEQALLEASQPASITGGQAAAQAVLGLMPMLLGYAIAKKRGALAGAKSGQAASQEYGKKIEDDAKLKRTTSALHAKNLLGEMSGIDRAKTSLDVANVKAQSARALQEQRQQHDYDMENRRQENRIALKETPGASVSTKEISDPKTRAILMRMQNEGTGDLSEEDYDHLLREGHLADIQRIKGQEVRGKAQEADFTRRLDEKIKERTIGGLEIKRDTEGKPMLPSTADHKEARKIISDWDTVKLYLNEAKDLHSNPKASAADKVANYAELVTTIKEMKNMGASFTGLERALVDAGLPGILTVKPSVLGDYLYKQSLGQNGVAAIERLIGNFGEVARMALDRRKYVLPTEGPSTTAGASEIITDKTGIRWEIVRDAAGKAIGKRPAQ